jgi:hypothetical protein
MIGGRRQVKHSEDQINKDILLVLYGTARYVSCVLYYKSFTIVIYDFNDGGLYCKTMIIANRVLARNMNYDH